MKFSSIENPVVGISIYHDVIDCGRFISMLEDACKDPNDPLAWDDAYTGASDISDYRSSVNCSLDIVMDPRSSHPLSPMLKNDIKYRIDACVEDYINQYRIPSGVHEPFQVLKYTEGAHYRAHFDTSSINPRYFSMVGVMRAPDDGGELEFPYFNYTFKPVEKSIIIFPANHPYTHIAHPVKKGLKYSLVTWFL